MRIRIALLTLFAVAAYAAAQVSPYTVKPFPAVTMTATGQTSTVIPMLSPGTGTGNSFSAGSITVTGTGLTTATFAIMGSTDAGATYFALPLSPIATPGTTALTQTVTSSGGIFQVNLATITHVKFVTSGTFTATSIQLALSASPNGYIARSSSGGAANSNAALSGTAIADYLMTDGSGTTVTDSSGNGNDATFVSGHNPVWGMNGLNFTVSTQGVSLPATLNTAKAFEVVGCISPMSGTITGQAPGNTYAHFIGNSLDTAGVTWTYAGSGIVGYYSLGVFAGGGNKDITNESLSGCHVATFVLGTSAGDLDRIYLDGNEMSYTATHGFSYGIQSSGNYLLGSAGSGGTFGGSGIIGTINRLRVLSTQLTPAQAQSDAVALAASSASRGVSLSLPQYKNYQPVMNLIGDSITCSWNGTNCVPAFSWGSQLTLTNQPTYQIKNWGIYGLYMKAMASTEPWRVSPYCKTEAGPAIAINFGGTNDLGGFSASQVAQYASSLASSLNTAGCETYIMTVLSRTGTSSAPGTPTNDAQKDSYNALVAANWKSWGYKGLLDVGADPLMGADGQGANTTYFLDGTHPTATGQGLIAASASRALNYYHSQYSISNPHIISASATLTTADGAVAIQSPTAPIALVMPDCLGPTGAPFVIANPQSAQTVTVAGASAAEPINGQTTAITIPANSSVTLTDVANPRSTAGCHWVM